jgi:acyl-CoA dehydrogenase
VTLISSLLLPEGIVSELNEFRADVRAWIDTNCPAALRGGAVEVFAGGRKQRVSSEMRHWFDRCYERGFTVPQWPKAYGGGGLDAAHARVLREEFVRARAPSPLGGMGVTMIGPTLLEHGNEEQKRRHLPKIANGEVRWCQGYSEPGAGSDLASLATRAVDEGDYYRVTGSKIWTSGANYADWIFCLVRTDPAAPKHEGISFLLFSMDSPGVTVKPILLISGQSPFCECFFDDVRVPKAELVGRENRGWTIAKRLLQHERSSISGLGGPRAGPVGADARDVARRYCGTRRGRIADDAFRSRLAELEMNGRAFALTQRRSHEENASGGTPTFATSMFKLYASEHGKTRAELVLAMMGSQGVGRGGRAFSAEERDATRTWLRGKASTIAGGTSEVQRDIIAKRVLGLPN